jgi:hypothetical protein
MVLPMNHFPPGPPWRLSKPSIRSWCRGLTFCTTPPALDASAAVSEMSASINCWSIASSRLAVKSSPRRFGAQWRQRTTAVANADQSEYAAARGDGLHGNTRRFGGHSYSARTVRRGRLWESFGPAGRPRPCRHRERLRFNGRPGRAIWRSLCSRRISYRKPLDVCTPSAAKITFRW